MCPGKCAVHQFQLEGTTAAVRFGLQSQQFETISSTIDQNFSTHDKDRSLDLKFF